jgi:HAD superfamily hydrolase (TIGR01549 family)
MLSFPVDTVIFDLDGTLRHNVPSAADTQFGYALQIGATVEPKVWQLGERWAHYYWAQSTDLAEDKENFEGMEDDFWINYSFRYLRALKVPRKRASELAPDLFALMKENYQPENTVYPCVPGTLQALKDTGLILGLISNRSRPCNEEIAELGLANYFDFIYVAAEVNAWKPDPRIFDCAIEFCQNAPAQILYVGDNYFADILGATSAGLQPVLLDGKGLFPEAECSIISKLDELVGLLSNGQK